MPPLSQRVLITGTAGAIGRRVGPFLREQGHFVRGFDLRPAPAGACDEQIIGSLNDPAALARACTGIDCLIHLAATSDEADFLTQLLPNNITGLYHVMEAARRAGIRRTVLASSVQVANAVIQRNAHAVLKVHDATAPTNFYGCTKVFLEMVGHLYAFRHQMTVICARLGWYLRNEQALARAQSRPAKTVAPIYLSHHDANRFFHRAVAADLPQGTCAVLWVMSRQTPGTGFDLEPAHQLIGYEPQDTFPDGTNMEAPLKPPGAAACSR